MLRQVAAGVAGTSLVQVEIAHAPEAGGDEGRCNRREYWLSRPSGDILVAVDCEAQWGADNPGPAAVKLQGTQIEVRYVEFQSSDRCESYAAKVSISGEKPVVEQTRFVGVVSKDACHVANDSAPVDPPGAGSADQPLLTLHR